jgi:hypothetical protein
LQNIADFPIFSLIRVLFRIQTPQLFRELLEKPFFESTHSFEYRCIFENVLLTVVNWQTAESSKR